MPTLTYSDFRTAVADKIGLSASVSTDADWTRVNSWINQGVEDFMARTGCFVTSTTFSTTNGVSDYTLSTSALAILEMDVTSGTDRVSMTRVTPMELLALRRTTTTASVGAGAPSRRFATQGNNLLMLWPTPTGTDTITYYYVPRPATLSASSDSPSNIPAEYQKAVEFYALAEAADYDDDTSSGQGDRYRGLYEGLVVRCRRELLRRGTRHMAPAVIGRRVRTFVVPGRDYGTWS